MRFKTFVFALGCMIVWLPHAAVSQDTIVLNSVEVSATAVRRVQETAMERRLDTLAMQRLNAVSMAQLLIQHSPVFIKTYGPGGLATASFRGTTASHTLVLWNGFQLNAPSLGQVDFSTIPVFIADDVSLQWGSSTSANSGGLGGIVNIDSHGDNKQGLILDLKQNYGSFNTLGSFATLGYSWQKTLLRVKAYRTSSDNDFTYNNIGVIPHSEMKQKNGSFLDYGVMPELQRRFKNSVLTAVSWNQWSHRNHPQIMPNVGNDNTKEYSDNRFTRNYIGYKYFWNNGYAQLKSALFYEEQHYFLETYTSNGYPVTSVNSINDALILHQIADVEQRLYRSWKLHAKAQWDMEQVTSNNYEGKKKRDVVSFYAAVNGRIFRDLHLRFTLRNDLVDGSSEGFFPTATVTYDLPFVSGLSICGGYSHNYRNPSLNDLYWHPGGNENLKPEDGKTIDLTLKYQYKTDFISIEAQVGGYRSTVSDWIQWVPTSYRFWMPENVASVKARGIEAHVGSNFIFGKWNFALSGNYMYSRTVDESNDKQLIYIPLHHGNMSASLRWKTWDLSYTMEVTGERKTSLNDEDKLPMYDLHHVGLGKTLVNKIKLELKINNLTGKDYQAVLWRPMPRRSLEASLNYKF